LAVAAALPLAQPRQQALRSRKAYIVDQRKNSKWQSSSWLADPRLLEYPGRYQQYHTENNFRRDDL
jgi:hypothetical protein